MGVSSFSPESFGQCTVGRGKRNFAHMRHRGGLLHQSPVAQGEILTMGTRVLLAAPLRPELGLSGSDGGLPVADSRHPDAVESTIESLASSDGQLIVACGEADYEDIRRIVTHAQVRIGHTRVAIETIPGTPLAISVVSSLADEISGHGDEQTARQFAAFDYLRANLWSAVWLPRVANLRSPQPSMVQHIRSWLPNSGFIATLSPSARVTAAGHAPLSHIPALPGYALINSPSEAPGWVVPAVAKELMSQSSSEVVPIRESIDAFGTKSAVEFIAVPADFHESSRPKPESIVECSGCGTHHSRPACPFCKMVSRPAEAPGANQ